MRIISQDGMIDVNYDLGNLSIAKGADDSVTQRSIYFHSCSCPRSTKLATYSTADKAQKAMERLRNVYYENEREKVYKDGVSYLTTHFQFPQDSEIEV